MNHSFTREQIKRIIVEELARSNDEDEAKELLQKIIGLNEDEADEFEAKLKKANSFRKMAGISLLGGDLVWWDECLGQLPRAKSPTRYRTGSATR